MHVVCPLPAARCVYRPAKETQRCGSKAQHYAIVLPQGPACHVSFVISFDREYGCRDGRLGLFAPCYGRALLPWQEVPIDCRDYFARYVTTH